VTIDEELNLLDQQMRRLKIEYDMFFINPTKRPPTDVEWKVTSLIRKFSDGTRMSFSQRYRYNEMAQRYAVYSDLWRKKMRIREEGIRRPQDAVLSVRALRTNEDSEATRRPVYGLSHAGEAVGDESEAFSVQCSGAAAERGQIESLYKVLTAAKQKAGEKVSGDFNSFATFVAKKTSEIRRDRGCDVVEYSVEMQDGHVKLAATPKVKS
jgi:hypothetical protein